MHYYWLNVSKGFSEVACSLPVNGTSYQRNKQLCSTMQCSTIQCSTMQCSTNVICTLAYCIASVSS